jgi:hypothetical protein
MGRPREMMVGQPQLYCSCCTKLPRCPGLLPARSCSDPTSDSLTSCLHVTHHAPGQPRHDGMSPRPMQSRRASTRCLTVCFHEGGQDEGSSWKLPASSSLFCCSPFAVGHSAPPKIWAVGASGWPAQRRLSGSFSIERVLQPACYKELSHHAQRSPSFTPLAKPTEACSSSLCAASLTN